MNALGLFSGIGGFELGLQRAGFNIAAMCEIDPFCRRVLRKHWPSVKIYQDVCRLTAEKLKRDGISVDLVCGGFPCQDVSVSGKRAGLSGTHSGLWREFARILGELRPHYAIVENTPGLLSLGFDDVLGDLATLGFDAEWHCIPAAAVGAEHKRDRVWIIANANSEWELQSKGSEQEQRGWTGNRPAPSPHTNGTRLSRRLQAGANECNTSNIGSRLRSIIRTTTPISRDYWHYQPTLGRRIYGVPDRVDRIRALGNAVVPQIPEIIGRAILEYEND